MTKYDQLIGIKENLNKQPCRKHRPKDWNKDRKWLKAPDLGIVEDEKVEKLSNWLKKTGSTESLEDLESWLDWENNKPINKIALMSVDPYNPIRGEKYVIKTPENMKYLFGNYHTPSFSTPSTFSTPSLIVSPFSAKIA